MRSSVVGCPTSTTKNGGGHTVKRALRGLLCERRFDEIAGRAERSTRVLGLLVSLTFETDAKTAWSAVEAIGLAAERVARTDPERVRDLLRRLHWLLSEESGGICWRAPEAMAEIVHHQPERFADYVPIISHLLVEMADEDLDHFRTGILWAIGRLGTRARETVTDVLPAVTRALDHGDPQVRGLAVWCLGRMGETDALERRRDLLDDGAEAELYLDGTLIQTTVGELAGRALSGSIRGP